MSLQPYASQLSLTWLRDAPDLRYRSVDGTLVFADISGFTKLTERLAAKGRFGAEEMSDLLDGILSRLLDAAYARGGWLVKWGGDALLLMYDGDDAVARACAASAEMRAVMREHGVLETTVGHVRLRMSVGIHSGSFDFVLVGRRHRELIITGDDATCTADMETTAEAGEIVISHATAALLPERCRGAAKGNGIVLAAVPPCAPMTTTAAETFHDDHVRQLLPELVVEHLDGGGDSGEHRQVAISFVEYRGIGTLRATRGMAAVVDAVERLVDVAQEATHRFGVSFHETDIGPDGGKIMLVAGAPRALDGPAEAMLCTVREIIDTPSVLTLRAGVTTGRVFTGGVGPAYRRSYSAKGDVINLAARVMGKTTPGQVWAVTSVVPQSRTEFRLDDVPPFLVKGKRLPIQAYAVGAPVRRGTGDAELALVGRADERAVLATAAADAQAGRGSVVEIVGDAGTGKSRLVTEAQRLAPGLGVLAAGAEPFRTSTPYAVVRPLLTDALGLGSTEPEAMATRLRAWCAMVAPELQPWLPLLGGALDLELPETPETRDLDEKFRKQRVDETIVSALAAALTLPSLITLDDAQFADDASMDVLRRLTESVAERPWLVVVARRASTGVESLASDDEHLLELGPLESDEALALVHAECDDAPLSPHVTEAVVNRGAGNPMFLRALTRAARDAGPAADLPGSVENVVSAQIDQLPPSDRDVLRAAAVIGMSVDPAMLSDLRNAVDGAAPAVQWERLDNFLRRDEHGYHFRQALFQSAAYAGLPYRRRAALHGQLADILAARSSGTGDDSALLSLHLLHAGRYEQARTTAEFAAERAATAYANVEAEALYTRALTAARHLPETSRLDIARLHEALGDVRARLGEFGASDTAYAAARRLRRDDPETLVRLAIKGARNAEHLGNFTLALGRLKRGSRVLGVSQAQGVNETQAQLHVRTAFLRIQQGKLAAARTSCLAALDAADETTMPAVYADALWRLDAANLVLGINDGHRHAERALELYEALGDLSSQARVLNHIGYRAYFSGRWLEALELYERMRQLFVRLGDSWNAAVGAGNIAEIYADQGRLAEAEATLVPVLRVWRASGAVNYVAFGSCLLGRILMRQARYDEATELLAQARDQFRDDGAGADVIDADTFLAECLLLRGQAADALAAARLTLDKARALSELPAQAPLLYRIIGACLDEAGDHTDAGVAFEEALRISRERDAGHETAFTLAALIVRARTLGADVNQSWIDEATELHRSLGLMLDLTSLDRPAARATIPEQRTSPAPSPR